MPQKQFVTLHMCCRKLRTVTGSSYVQSHLDSVFDICERHPEFVIKVQMYESSNIFVIIFRLYSSASFLESKAGDQQAYLLSKVLAVCVSKSRIFGAD